MYGVNRITFGAITRQQMETVKKGTKLRDETTKRIWVVDDDPFIVGSDADPLKKKRSSKLAFLLENITIYTLALVSDDGKSRIIVPAAFRKNNYPLVKRGLRQPDVEDRFTIVG